MKHLKIKKDFYLKKYKKKKNFKLYWFYSIHKINDIDIKEKF